MLPANIVLLACQPSRICLCVKQIDALGDANHQIREIASSALQQVLQQWTLPIALPELALAWVHRNYLVKEGAILLVTATIKANPVAITVPAQWQHLVLQPAVKLLGDPHRCCAQPLEPTQYITLSCMLTS